MKKICLIFTGGTIGSTAKNGIIDVDASTTYQLLGIYRKRFGGKAEFDIFNPFNILSENIAADNLIALKDIVEEKLDGGYSGIIVTHGTDTLAYTAAFLSFCFPRIDIPVMLVSSNYPLGDERSNGPDIFNCAVNYIENSGRGGVFALSKNTGENVKLHYGLRLMQARQVDGYFDSIGGQNCGEFTEAGFVKNNDHLMPMQFLPKLARISLETDILYIRAYALQNFKLYDFSKVRPKAIVVELYHSGTINTAGEYSFLDFCDYCSAFDIDVVIAPLGESVYAGADELTKKKNVIIAPGLGIEAALIKTMLAYGSLPPSDRARFLAVSAR